MVLDLIMYMAVVDSGSATAASLLRNARPRRFDLLSIR
jgi:hypothetical protein